MARKAIPASSTISVTYTLSDKNELTLDYNATTDKATPVNLTNHSYFNLAGAGRGHRAEPRIDPGRRRYTPVDDTLIPLGKDRAGQGHAV